MKFLTALLLFGGVSWAATYLPDAQVVPYKGFRISVLGSYFNTTSKFDENGKEQALSTGEAFTMYQGDGIFKYGFARNTEVGIETRFRTNTSQTTSQEISNSGMESYAVSMKYNFPRLEKSKLLYAVEFKFRQTTYSNSSYQAGAAPADDLVLGDDGREITASLFADYPWGKVARLGGKVAYNMPPNDLSHEVLYNGELALVYSSVAWKAGVDGCYSLGQDEYTSTNKPAMSTGVTNLYNSINRSYVAPYVGLNILFESLSLGAKASQVTMGSSTDKGLWLMGFLSWTSKGKKEKLDRVEQFKEYQIEASVIKVSPRSQFIKIDQGLANDVAKGMRIDIYQTDYFGGNLFVASGYVYELGADWAIVKLTKKYQNIAIKTGFTARGY